MKWSSRNALSLSLSLSHTHTHTHAYTHTLAQTRVHTHTHAHLFQAGRGSNSGRVRPVSHSSCILLKYVGWLSYFCSHSRPTRRLTHPLPPSPSLSPTQPTHTFAKNTSCIRATFLPWGKFWQWDITHRIFSASDRYQNGTMKKRNTTEVGAHCESLSTFSRWLHY